MVPSMKDDVPLSTAPVFRPARRDDVPAIIRLLADDPLGARREEAADPLPDFYWRAFEAVDRDPNNHLIVADLAGRIVGCLQLTIIPGLSRKGLTRGQIESVRVAGDIRGRKIGEALIAHAEAEARRLGAGALQLTTDKSRADAHRFYERLGFAATHVGMKRELG